MVTSTFGQSLGNSIGERFSRSWEVAKASFHVMRQDKEILLFPLLSSIFSFILLLIFVLPFFLVVFFESEEVSSAAPILVYGGIFIFYFLVTFFAIFFNAGVVHIAKTRFEGGDATFKDGIKAGFTHLGAIIKWALVSATIGLILNALESKARQEKGIGGIIAHIVITAIVLKNIGPWEALKSSVSAIKKTWGESLIRFYGLGLIQGGFIFVGVIAFFIPGILLAFFFGSLLFGGIMIGLFTLYATIVGVIFSSANTIYNTALFIYADTGKVPKIFPPEVVKGAFRKK
ncbi:hypothetical protein HYX12_04895 [Candidatus Woesearchaeota archaeon]|nr:hypothetical protein [Candidatus Woesearchaeota archaeon]